jgi:hypothetical protein
MLILIKMQRFIKEEFPLYKKSKKMSQEFQFSTFKLKNKDKSKLNKEKTKTSMNT